MASIHKCKVCSKEFKVYGQQAEKGRGIYCSRACMNVDPEINSLRSRNSKAAWADPESRAKLQEAIVLRSQSEEWKGAAHFQKGAAHPKFKAGKADRKLEGARYEYKKWRSDVFHRDNFTCAECRQKGGKLVAHHVQEWAKYPDLRYEVSNGKTLCEGCHDKAHGLNRRPRIYKCIDCGAPKRFRGLSPRCRRCAAHHSYADSRRTQPKNCETCNASFMPGHKTERFCSSKCGAAPRKKRVIVNCTGCGKELERTPSAVEGHKSIFCGRACMGATRKGVPRGTY